MTRKEGLDGLPERTMGGCGAPKSAAPDLNKLERKLLGSGYRMVCRHPDIDGDAIDAATRSCLIDSGQPEQCEMSQSTNPERVTDKSACQFWLRKAAKEPTRLSISESLALIAALRGSGSSSVAAQVSQPIRDTK